MMKVMAEELTGRNTTGKTTDAQGAGVKTKLKLSFWMFSIARILLLGSKTCLVVASEGKSKGGWGRAEAVHLIAVTVLIRPNTSEELLARGLYDCQGKILTAGQKGCWEMARSKDYHQGQSFCSFAFPTVLA